MKKKSLIVGALRPLPTSWLLMKNYGVRLTQEDYYTDLRNALTVIADKLKDDGWKATVVADENSLVDRAIRAGIGWHGKNGNVLIPGKGSWLF